ATRPGGRAAGGGGHPPQRARKARRAVGGGRVEGAETWPRESPTTRRYETASTLAADVQRYLTDEPVLACPPSGLYRFRKFARRNKVLLATGSVIVLAVLVAVGSLVFSNVRISQEASEKTRALEAAQISEKDAVDSLKDS